MNLRTRLCLKREGDDTLSFNKGSTKAKGPKLNEQSRDIPQKDLPKGSTRSSNKSRAPGWLQDFHNREY